MNNENACEIHVTISPSHYRGEFLKACEKLQARGMNAVPLFISNYHWGDKYSEWQEPEKLIAYNFTTPNIYKAYDTLKNIYYQFTHEKIRIVRGKIEVGPTHPEALKHKGLEGSDDKRYFETHFELQPWGLQHASAKDIAISRINNKKFMGTFRSYDTTISEFEKQVANLVGKDIHPEIEFCIYDSNVEYDKEWMESYNNHAENLRLMGTTI